MAMENVLNGEMPELPLSPIEKSTEQAQAENSALQELRDVAGIPGWERIRKQMLADADALLRHKDVTFDAKTPDAEVGRILRNQLIMADWIQAYVERIDSAFEAAKQLEETEQPTVEEPDDV